MVYCICALKIEFLALVVQKLQHKQSVRPQTHRDRRTDTQTDPTEIIITYPHTWINSVPIFFEESREHKILIMLYYLAGAPTNIVYQI